MKIPFNKPYVTGREAENISQAITNGHVSANGFYTGLCSRWFDERFGFKRTLMTTSCTAALEMSAMLCEIGSGDEVIMPSFTFVSTALAFAKFGARIRFVDSLPDHPNMDCSLIEALITPRTKAIVAVHYNGVLCDMDAICALASKYNLIVIEDAAHAVNTNSCGRRGDLVTMSFHETKNIHCGEGGLLGVNNEKFVSKAEKLWMKGTNRLDFERGMTGKYQWVDTGGAYAISELGAAFLRAQIACFDNIIARREEQWQRYLDNLRDIEPELPQGRGSSHIFYLVCDSKSQRDKLIEHFASHHVLSPFHYQALHRSPYGERFSEGEYLPNADKFSDCLLRLPLYYELTDTEIDAISQLMLKR